MNRRKRWTTAALGVIGLVAVVLGAGRMAFFVPPDRMGVPVTCAASAALAPSDRPLTVLVWNIQFAAGRGQEFFYDGGTAVSVTPDIVEKTLDDIAAVIRRVDPDVVLLQEVDRDSRRTGRIDQHQGLLDRLDYPCHVSTPYHRAPYVPHPPEEHLGRVDMHLSVLSRFKMDSAVRYQLPMLQESPLRRLFNLRRAVLEVRLPLSGGGDLVMLDTHLSAFSRGDGTLGKQVAHLQTLGESLESEGVAWLLAGDLNSLPPGDDPSQLPPDAQALYAEAESPIQPLFDRFASPVPREAWATDPEMWRTYLPFGAAVPDRTLDYAFHGSSLITEHIEVLHHAAPHSDHLPLLLKVKVIP